MPNIQKLSLLCTFSEPVIEPSSRVESSRVKLSRVQSSRMCQVTSSQVTSGRYESRLIRSCRVMKNPDELRQVASSCVESLQVEVH